MLVERKGILIQEEAPDDLVDFLANEAGQNYRFVVFNKWHSLKEWWCYQSGYLVKDGNNMVMVQGNAGARPRHIPYHDWTGVTVIASSNIKKSCAYWISKDLDFETWRKEAENYYIKQELKRIEKCINRSKRI